MPDYSALKARLALPDCVGLSDADAAAHLMTTTTTTAPVSEVPKEVFSPLLAAAIGRVYDPAFAHDRAYWAAILTLWGSLEVVHAADPHTQWVIARALAEGVLTQAEVAAATTATTTATLAEQIPGWGLPVTAADVAHARSLS